MGVFPACSSWSATNNLTLSSSAWNFSPRTFCSSVKAVVVASSLCSDANILSWTVESFSLCGRLKGIVLLVPPQLDCALLDKVTRLLSRVVLGVEVE